MPVTFEEQHEFALAAQAFGSSLRSVKRAQQLFEEQAARNHETILAETYQAMSEVDNHIRALHEESCAQSPPVHQFAHGMHDHRGLIVYTRPVLLNVNSDMIKQWSSITSDNVRLYKDACHDFNAVIMFNMALTHHTRSLDAGVCNAASSTQKAFSSYKLSLSLLSKSTSPGMAEMKFTLNKAILNNMGQILLSQNQPQVARQYFNGLSALLEASNIHEDDDNKKNDICSQWDGFAMNLLRTSSCPSPAA